MPALEMSVTDTTNHPNLRLTWDGYFTAIAELAALRSRDPSLKVGSVVVSPDRVILATGYNGLPRGVRTDAARLERPEKYEWMVHAEANAILNAARVGARITGATLYASQMPCHRCASMMIQAGITRAVCPEGATQWLDPSGSRERAWKMMREAGVAFVWLTYPERYEEVL